MVLSLLAAYKRNLFNLLSLIRIFNSLFFTLFPQCSYIYANIFIGRLQRNARGDKQEKFNNENILPIQNKTD